MKISAAVLLTAIALAGCMGPEGNPDGMPYATDPGAMMAAPPRDVGTVTYNPNANPAPGAGMQVGPPGFNPLPPTPATPAR